MPFTSQRQMRAAFAGKIPGFSKERAHEWAEETPDIKELPDRAPAEKGKATLRSKAAEGILDTHDRLVDAFSKIAALGTILSSSSQVGRIGGTMTTNALKAPGVAATQQAINPRRSIAQAMGAFRAR